MLDFFIFNYNLKLYINIFYCMELKLNILRNKAIKDDKLLMTKFNNSIQETDITTPTNCDGFGRVHHFKYFKNKRWMSNPLPAVAVKENFNSQINVKSTIEVEVFQLSVCNFNCWYCFVDKKLREGNKEFSSFVSPRELLIMCNRDNVPNVISLSGGQPDIVPEYQLYFLRDREYLELDNKYFLWSDDNLSSDMLWKWLTDKDIEYMIGRPNYVRVGCLKGFDKESFSFNTGASPELFENQIQILKRLVNTGFKQYGYITLTTNDLNNVKDKVRYLFDKIQNDIGEDFLLKLIPLEIFKYNVNKDSIIEKYLLSQYEVIDIWKDELLNRFSKDELINNYIEF